MSLKQRLHRIFKEWEEYVLSSLLFEDTDIDTFATWAENHYQMPRILCTSWEYLYA